VTCPANGSLAPLGHDAAFQCATLVLRGGWLGGVRAWASITQQGGCWSIG
jgi:hypothetical protein